MPSRRLSYEFSGVVRNAEGRPSASSPATSPVMNIMPTGPMRRYSTAVFKWSPTRYETSIGGGSVTMSPPSLVQVASVFGPSGGQV